MRILIFSYAVLFCISAAPAATHKSAHRKPTGTSRAVSKNRGIAHRATGRRGAKRSLAARVPARPQGPSADRYREIQEALVAKGYLKSEPSGSWDQDSADALKRFQADRELSQTGKVNSRTLIALGLGPKDETEHPSATAPTGQH